MVRLRGVTVALDEQQKQDAGRVIDDVERAEVSLAHVRANAARIIAGLPPKPSREARWDEERTRLLEANAVLREQGTEMRRRLNLELGHAEVADRGGGR